MDVNAPFRSIIRKKLELFENNNMRIILYSFICFILSVNFFSCSSVKKHTQEENISASLNFGSLHKVIDFGSWYFFLWGDSIDFRNNFGTERQVGEFDSLLSALPIEEGLDTLSFLYFEDNDFRKGHVEEICERERKIGYLYDTKSSDSLLIKFAEFSYFYYVARLHGGLPVTLADKLLDHVSQFVNKGYVKTPYLYVLYKLYAIDNIKKNQYETARLNIDKAIDLCKQVYERKGLGELYAWASIIARKDKNEKEALSLSDSAQFYNTDSTAAIFSRELPESYNTEFLKPYSTTSNLDFSHFFDNIAIENFNRLESLVRYNFINNRDNGVASKKYFDACDDVYEYVPLDAKYDLLSHVRHIAQIYSIPKENLYPLYFCFGRYYFSLWDMKSCVENLLLAENSCLHSGNDYKLSQIYSLLSYAYSWLGDYERMEKSLSLSKQYNPSSNPFLEEIAIKRLMKKYDDAINYAFHTQDSIEKKGTIIFINDYDDYNGILLELARCYYLSQNYAVADSFINMHLTNCVIPDTIHAKLINSTLVGSKFPRNINDQALKINCQIGYKLGEIDYLKRLGEYEDYLHDGFSQWFTSFAEVERAYALGKLINSLNHIHNCSLLKYDSDAIAKAVYNNALYTKMVSLTSTKIEEKLISQSGDSSLIDKYNYLKTIKQDLNYKNYNDTSFYLLLNQSIMLEKQIKKDLPNLWDSLVVQKQFHWDDVRNSLEENETAIEFISSQDIDQISDSIMLFALVLRNDYECPKIVPVCNETMLRTMITSHSSKDNRAIDRLYSWKNNGQYLYKMCISALDPYLDGTSSIYISKTGILNSINFNAIPCSSSEFLMDKYYIRDVSSTAEIISIKQERQEMNYDSAALYGGLDYFLDEKMLSEQSSRYKMQYQSENFLAVRGEDEDREGLAYLEWTKTEVDSIAQRLVRMNCDTILYKDCYGVEESIKNMDEHSPSIIHLATHGFYLYDEEHRNNKTYASNRNGMSSKLQPLLYSGLHMSGSAHVWYGEQPIEGIDDGILTAEEISWLDFSNTKLVVLSACDSGKGAYDEVEGVVGLQKGFKKAGVQSIVMSLWRVPDQATYLLMQKFYQYMSEREPRHQALIKAMRDIRNMPGYSSPHNWAAFVMLD